MALVPVSDIANYTRTLFERHTPSFLLYHNIDHTSSVVDYTNEIAGHYGLRGQELYVLQAAAWFHDTGHLFGDMKGHEEISDGLMRKYLLQQDTDASIVEMISRCILATKIPAQPNGLLEYIICDADTYHLGTPAFLRTDESVWQEYELRTYVKVPDKRMRSLAFLETHHFYTDYCRSLLNAGKRVNIEILRERLAREGEG